MKNHIYRIELAKSDGTYPDIEFSVAETNELNPVRDILCLGICMMDKESQFDGSLDEKELESLIDYLQDCQRYISNFNKNSKPIIES